MKFIFWSGFLGLSLIQCSAFAPPDTPRQYIAYQTNNPLRIDGEAEVAWEAAPWSEDFMDIEGIKLPRYRTRMKMLWDSLYLYCYAELEEPHVWADITQRDAVIFHNNDFEIFIDPDGDTHDYMEIEINALNTVWDLFLTKPYRNHPRVIDAWDIPGLKTAVQVRGTLNQPEDTDEGWSVEIAFPWAALLEASTERAVPEEQFWRINFSRVNWDFTLEDGRYLRRKDNRGNYLPEYNWVWSPQAVINMHEPERWGYVYFSPNTHEPDTFVLPPDEEIKWKLYEQYRRVRSRPKAKPDSISVGEYKLPVYREEHRAGWNLGTLSPFSGREILLQEDGKLRINPAD